MSRKLLGDFAALLGGLQSPIKWYHEKKEKEEKKKGGGGGKGGGDEPVWPSGKASGW